MRDRVIMSQHLHLRKGDSRRQDRTSVRGPMGLFVWALRLAKCKGSSEIDRAVAWDSAAYR
jgi:hypothetical protein